MKKYISKFSYDIGKELPDVSLFDRYGKEYHLNKFKGKVLYINIWSTSCGPCLAIYPNEVELLNQLELNGDSAEIKIINICTGLSSNTNTWIRLLDSRKDNSLNLFAADSIVFTKWNLQIVWPTFLLIGKNGKILGKKAPRPDEGSIPYMLLAATKDIPAKESLWNGFIQSKKMMKGEVDIDPFYLEYIKKYLPENYKFWEYMKQNNDYKSPAKE